MTDRLYDMALLRTQHYTPREQTLILLHFDSLWLRWFDTQPTDEQSACFQQALRTHLQKEMNSVS